jgi:hypothetical protein
MLRLWRTFDDVIARRRGRLVGLALPSTYRSHSAFGTSTARREQRPRGPSLWISIRSVKVAHM